MGLSHQWAYLLNIMIVYIHSLASVHYSQKKETKEQRKRKKILLVINAFKCNDRRTVMQLPMNCPLPTEHFSYTSFKGHTGNVILESSLQSRIVRGQ